MIMSLVFYFYKYILAPLTFFLFQILRPFLNAKLRELVGDKNTGFYKIQKPGSENSLALARPFWIHAASGEIEYARPVIRELKRKYPETPILVTYSSPSAKKILESVNEVDLWTALPWEFDFSIQNFIKKWNPRMLLFARTDVWPVVASVAKKQHLPMVLFSATFAENSSRLNGPGRYLTRYTLNNLTEIHCVSAEDLHNVETLKLKTPCQITGDTRFDQVFHRLANPSPLKSELIPSPEDFIFIAGSTWPEDEAVVVPALAQLQAVHIRSIIAPHENTPDHLEKLERQIKDAGLISVRYSQASTWPAGAILIIDQMGILAELYTWADIAFIGGSFKRQVHSVMEALAAGLPVMVGPYHRNNREALFYQKKNYSSGMIVQVIKKSEDIAVLLQRMKKQQERISHIKEEICTEIGKNRHSTQRVVSAIEKLLT